MTAALELTIRTKPIYVNGAKEIQFRRFPTTNLVALRTNLLKVFMLLVPRFLHSS